MTSKKVGQAGLATISQVLGEVARPLELPRGTPQSVMPKLHPTSPAIQRKAAELEQVAARTGDVPWEDLHQLVLLIALRRMAQATTMAEVAAAERALAIIYNRAPNPASTRRGSRAPVNPRGPQRNPRGSREQAEDELDDSSQAEAPASTARDSSVDFEVPQV